MFTVYVYVLDTLADWEIGHVTAELHSRRFFKKDAPQVAVKTVGISREPVKTMGGLTVIPDGILDDVEIAETSVLLLPGADTWDDPKQTAVIEKAGMLLSAGGTACGICGATVALAAAGLLDHRPHTSNGVGFLDMFCPGYGIHQRLTGHMDITLHGCRYVPMTCSVRWLWLRRYDGNHGTAYTQNPMYLHLRNTTVSATLLPPLLYTSLNFSPLREAKNGENRPEKLQLSQRFRKSRCRR